MGKLNKTDVKKVAELANLEITDKELGEYVPQLSQIVEYVSELDEIDTDGIEATSQTTGLENVSRNDEVNQQREINSTEALSETENKMDDYFAVDMILKEKNLT